MAALLISNYKLHELQNITLIQVFDASSVFAQTFYKKTVQAIKTSKNKIYYVVNNDFNRKCLLLVLQNHSSHVLSQKLTFTCRALLKWPPLYFIVLFTLNFLVPDSIDMIHFMLNPQWLKYIYLSPFTYFIRILNTIYCMQASIHQSLRLIACCIIILT